MIPMFLLTLHTGITTHCFRLKVSLVLLQRDPDLMLTHTKRPNLTNYVAFMTYWH